MAQSLSLSGSEVHLWRVWLEFSAGTLAELEALLDQAERERAARFRFDRDRRRHVAVHGLLRLVLGRYADLRPEEIRFRHGPRGKPELAASGRLRFNVSDSDDLALFAVALDREVGVDLERVRPVPEADLIADRVFAPGERAALKALPEADRAGTFFVIWTRKEACLKAGGEGLFRAPEEIEVWPAPEVDGRWTVLDLVPAPGFVGALAVSGAGWKPVLWEWPDRRLEPAAMGLGGLAGTGNPGARTGAGGPEGPAGKPAGCEKARGEPTLAPTREES